jgi:molybdopterin molybdotransferase
MLSYKKAQEIIIAQAKSFGTEKVKLEASLGRVLADGVFAPRDLPPFNRAAVDGYALRFIDFEQGVRSFKIVETIFAGQKATKELLAGECYKIMTGAAVPTTANTVFRREDTDENGDFLRINIDKGRVWQNIAVKGQDLKKGALGIPASYQINASAIGFLTSLGQTEVSVQKQPRVAILTTGDEIKALGERVDTFQIYNSNLSVLKALLAEYDIEVSTEAHVLDDQIKLKGAIAQNLHQDILILTGGVSAGDADYVPEILKDLGVEVLFHKVAIKPGKPFLCGKINDGAMIFALPGNPFSCLVTFKIFVDTYLRSCLNLQPKPIFKLPVDFNRTKRTGFDEFFPVSIKGPQATLELSPLNGSGDIRLGTFSNALAIQAADQMEIEKGEEIYYLPIN